MAAGVSETGISVSSGSGETDPVGADEDAASPFCFVCAQLFLRTKASAAIKQISRAVPTADEIINALRFFLLRSILAMIQKLKGRSLPPFKIIYRV